MIDLNNEKKLVTKKGLLKYIKDHDVYEYYSGKKVEIGNSILSPLVKEKNPSFGYYLKNNEILFNDFRLGGGDFIKFVQLMFNLRFNEALSKIVIDFNLEDKFHYLKISNDLVKKVKKDFKFSEIEIINHPEKKIQIKRRKWKIHDDIYWNNFGISRKILNIYNVFPISYFFINEVMIKADKFAYAFMERKDNKVTYKIYQPFNNSYKWINDHDHSVWQGWTQMPKKGNELIITKSLKDVMSIVNILKIPSISLQAESVLPKRKIINELVDRFDNIYIFYDNDFDSDRNWGQIYAQRLCTKFKKSNFQNIKIPDDLKIKDFSDLIKKKGKKEAIKIFKQEIIIPF